MRIHGFALLLLLGSATAVAAPPDAPAPVDEIDVDAMARAKDVRIGGDEATPSAAADPAEAVDAVHADEAATPTAPDGTTGQQDIAEADPATAPPAADEAATDDGAAAGDAGESDAAVKEADATAPQDDAATEEAASTPAEPVASEAAAAERRSADACIARAGALLDAAQAHDYEKATRDFDAKMRSALTAAQFQQAWESLAQFGKFTARGQSHPGAHEGYVVVTIPLVFEKANLYAQVSCGSDGRIAGFYVKPLQLPVQ